MNRHRMGACLLTAALLTALAGCSSGQRNSAKVSPLTSASSDQSSGMQAGGSYTSRFFLVGLGVTLPQGWTVANDESLELTFRCRDFPGAVLRITKGLFPVSRSGDFLTSRMSTRAIVAGLRSNPDLAVSATGAMRLGKLHARTADVQVSSRAPGGRLDYLAYKGTGMGTAFGLTKGLKARVYVTIVRQGFGPDLFEMVAETNRPGMFGAWTKAAEGVLGTLTLPEGMTAT